MRVAFRHQPRQGTGGSVWRSQVIAFLRS